MTSPPPRCLGFLVQMLLLPPPRPLCRPSPFLAHAMLTSDLFLSPAPLPPLIHVPAFSVVQGLLFLPPPPPRSPLSHLTGSCPHLNLGLMNTFHIYHRNQHGCLPGPLSAPTALEDPSLALISDFWLAGCWRALIYVSAGGRTGHGAGGVCRGWGGGFPPYCCPLSAQPWLSLNFSCPPPPGGGGPEDDHLFSATHSDLCVNMSSSEATALQGKDH